MSHFSNRLWEQLTEYERRYDGKLEEATRFRCQTRCWWSKQDPAESDAPCVLQPHNKKAICVLQPHSRKDDGRVFACKFCDFETCIDCDRPEHVDETCDEYRLRAVDRPQHNKAEVANGKKFERCPSCAAFWQWAKGAKGCGYTKCEACKFRFCGNCMIPWVGEGSAYLLGKSGHKVGCRYRTKDTESTKALMKRHESDFQASARIDGSNELEQGKKESKMEAKMVEAKRKAAEAEEAEGLGDGLGKVAKKQKKLTMKA